MRQNTAKSRGRKSPSVDRRGDLLGDVVGFLIAVFVHPQHDRLALGLSVNSSLALRRVLWRINCRRRARMFGVLR